MDSLPSRRHADCASNGTFPQLPVYALDARPAGLPACPLWGSGMSKLHNGHADASIARRQGGSLCQGIGNRPFSGFRDNPRLRARSCEISKALELQRLLQSSYCHGMRVQRLTCAPCQIFCQGTWNRRFSRFRDRYSHHGTRVKRLTYVPCQNPPSERTANRRHGNADSRVDRHLHPSGVQTSTCNPMSRGSFLSDRLPGIRKTGHC